MLSILSSIYFHACLFETESFYVAQVILELKHVHLMLFNAIVIGYMLSVSFRTKQKTLSKLDSIYSLLVN